MISIFVDGDACPVKEETYVVATRYSVPVMLVANSYLYVPEGMGVEMVVVDQGLDAADDWIAERVGPGDVAFHWPRAASKQARAFSAQRAENSVTNPSAVSWPRER